MTKEEIAVGFGSWLLSKVGDKLFTHLTSSEGDTNKLDQKFSKICFATIDKITKKYDDDYADGIRELVTNEKAITIFYEYLFKDSLLPLEGLETISDLTTLPHDFLQTLIASLKDECSNDANLHKILVSKDMLIAVKGLTTQIEEIKSHLSLSTTEITKIRDKLEKYFNQNFDFAQFHKRYRSAALSNLSQLSFIGLGVDVPLKKGNRKKIQDIFVKPNFAIQIGDQLKKNKQNNGLKLKGERSGGKTVKLADLFSRSKKVVVLGSPGAGKSLLIKTIICELLSKRENIFHDKEVYNYLPIRIELRKYLAYKKANYGSLIEYVLNLLKGEYCVHAITIELLKNIFEEKLIMIFFDGLDEIFDSTDKFNIKLEIEALHEVYPNFASLTTSRLIGYEEAKLNDEFVEYKILKFNTDQIKEYLIKWYDKEDELEDTKKQEIKDFLNKSKELDDELVSNPLLLSLIVLLYKNDLKIPESKLEIYQSCTKTLVDKWDGPKELTIALDNEILKKKEIVLAGLAYWQYEESSKGAQITNQRTKNAVAEILAAKFDDDDVTNFLQPAEAFLNYAEKRSIYFDNNFTHKTFLEYFTAYYIYINIEKKYKADERNKILLKHIDNSYWYIVFELLFNFIDKDQPDTEIVDGIVRMLLSKKETSIPFLLNILPTIKNISQKCSSEVIRKAIVTILKLEKAKGTQSLNLKKRIFECLQKLTGINRYKVIALKIFNEIEAVGEDPNIYYLFIELLYFRFFEPNPDKLPLTISNVDYYKSLLKKDALLFVEDLNSINTYNLKDDYAGGFKFFNTHLGIDSVFGQFRTKFINLYFAEYLYMYLYWQLLSENIKSVFSTFEDIEGSFDFIELLLNKNEHKNFFAFGGPLESIDLAKLPNPKKYRQIVYIILLMSIFARGTINDKDLDLTKWLLKYSDTYPNALSFYEEFKKTTEWNNKVALVRTALQ